MFTPYTHTVYSRNFLADSFGNLDAQGIIVGTLAFALAGMYALSLLQKFQLNTKPIMNIVALSLTGHILGAIAFYWFAIRYGADSGFYYENATTHFSGFGYFFAFFIIGYLKAYFTGQSFLGLFLISGAFAFIASIYYFLTYKILLDKLSGSVALYRQDTQQLLYPALLLLCWPSYLFFSSGLVKDNFAFLSIGLFLFMLARGRWGIVDLIKLAAAVSLGIIVRPYLFIIIISSYIAYTLLNSQQRPLIKIGILIGIFFLMLILAPFVDQNVEMASYSGHFSLHNMGKFAVHQQEMMSDGSSIVAPTHDPLLTFLFLPYLILVNLFLPLGIGASNLIGLLSSIENAFLVGWVLFFISQRTIWKELRKKLPITLFFLTYFLFGISCLSLMSTNFGLAMREKIMYVPPLLICIFLTYAYKRMLLIQKAQDYASQRFIH